MAWLSFSQHLSPLLSPDLDNIFCSALQSATKRLRSGFFVILGALHGTRIPDTLRHGWGLRL